MKKGQKSKNILFISRLYYPHIGGVEKHIEKISNLLVKKGYRVTVVCEQHDRNLSNNEKIDGVSIIRIPVSASDKNKKFEIWKWMLMNKDFIKKFDIIHIHDVFFWIFPLCPILDRKKVFITFHGYEKYPVSLSSKLQKKLAFIYCTNSIIVGEYINRWFSLDSRVIIYGAADVPKKSSIRINADKSAVFFGRLDNTTGIKEYYNAYLRLTKKYKDFKFTVIGNGDFPSKMRKLSISPFKSNIKEEIMSNRFVFVSGYLSMIEAMIQKRLVFALYNNPLKKDYLLNSPFSKYAEVCSSSGEIADRVEFYLQNPKIESEKTRAAYEWASKQTWEKLLSVYLKLWKI